ncbi:MAG: ADP-ribosyltransferase [Methanobacteriaceae archaeon]
MTKYEFKNVYTSLDAGIIELSKKTVLYRGIKNIKPENFYIGEKIYDRGYQSTTFDKEVAIDYAEENGSVIKIKAGKRTLGIYIRQHSLYPEELEFLLRRKTTLNIYNIGEFVFAKI